MRTLIATIVALFGVIIAHAVETDTIKFTTRSNSGPEKDYTVTTGARWSVDAGGTLRVTAITDSSAQGILFMEMVIPGWQVKPFGQYPLTSTTTWKYGHNTGQVVICQSGLINISPIDSTTDRINATFQWTGKATPPSGVVLNSTISKGSFSLHKTPQLAHDIVPKNGVKWRPDEKVKLTVFTHKFGSQQEVGGADVTLQLPPGIFEDITTTKTSNGNGRAEWLLQVKGKAEGGEYNILISSKKTGFEDSRLDTFKFKVDTTYRYYYGKCAGAPFLEFDAGEDEKWKDGGGSTITSTGEIKINSFITINGTVDIDTVGGGAKVSGNGKISVPAVYIDGAFQPFVFLEGAFAFPSIGCDGLIDFLALPIAQQLAGTKIKELKLRILGDFVKSAGASITATIEGPRNMGEGCNDAVPFGTVWAPSKRQSFTAELRILDSLGAWYVSGSSKATNVAIGPTICVKEMSMAYDARLVEFTIAGKAKTPFFEELGASVTLKDGTLNKFSGNFKLDACIPIPETPVCFKGGSVAVENIAIGNPFKASITSLLQVTGKPLLMELEFSGGIESPPNTLRATGTARWMNVASVSAIKPWQFEASQSFLLSIDNYSIADSGTFKALHLGGDYFFDGKYKATIGLVPNLFFSFAGSAALKLPAIEASKAKEMGMLGRLINGYAPITLGNADLTMMIANDGEQSLSANIDFRNLGGTLTPEIRDALRAIGKASIFVDFKKLPSPSAITVDAGILNVLSGLFGEVQNVRPGKTDEAVQAAGRTFAVEPGETELIVMSSTTTPPADLTLRTPAATVLTAADPAQGIYRIMSADNEIVLWIIKNPQAGTWGADQPQGRVVDSIVAGVNRSYPDLAINAQQTGDVLTVSWNATDYPAGARIVIHGDPEAANDAGPILYEGPANVSPALITLTDTTAPCAFNMNARLSGPGVSTSAKVAGSFNNPKNGLLPPLNAMAVTNQLGVTSITWSPITNGIVGAVVVYRVDGGRMEVVTSAANYETGFTFTMPQPEGAILKIASVDKKGRSGCLSDAISVPVDVKELEHHGNGITMWLAPNPAFDQVTVRTDKANASNVSYKLIDMLGATVLTHGGQAAKTTLDLRSLSSGTYILVAQVGEKHVASTLRIVR